MTRTEELEAKPVQDEQPLTPDELAAREGTTPGTVRDWIQIGVRVSDPKTGQRKRVRLKARKVGGRWRILPADMVAFTNATTSGSLPPGPEVPPTEPALTGPKRKRRKSADDSEVNEALRSLGLPVSD